MERLRLLNLEGAPAGVAMAEVTRIWAETLSSRNVAWQRELDEPRLHQAFMELEARCDRWPTPNMLMQRLPARSQPRGLPRPRMSEAERKRNRARLRQMMEEALGNG